MRLIDAYELMQSVVPKNEDAEFRCVPLSDIINAPNAISSSNVASTNALTIGGTSLDDMIEAKIKALEKNTRFTFTELSCRNCGGKINQKIDDYIVKCPYCGTAYLIGREQIYSR